MTGLFTKTFTVQHRTPTGTDAAGRPTYTTASATVAGGYSHKLSADRLDAGLVVVDEWTAYLPAATVIAPGDLVTVDGGQFEVVSAPFPAWNHRTGSTHHIEVRLRKADR